MLLLPALLPVLLLPLLSPASVRAGDWSRFRGPNGTGIASDFRGLPTHIGADTNLLWKTPLPDGISSPVVAGGRVFLTTQRPGPKLAIVALDAGSGRILWQFDVPARVGNPPRGGNDRAGKGKAGELRLATPTPTTDGKSVISFFESSGLFCHDVEGKLLWTKWFGPVDNKFGHGASPILVDHRVIQLVDHDGDSFLVALDLRTGEELWRSYRYVFGRNYATPVLWSFGDERFIVVAGSGLITGYHVATGIPAWYCRGTSGVVNPSPIVSETGKLFVHGRSPAFGAKSSPFKHLVMQFDKNGDNGLQREELPPCFLKTFHEKFDADGDGAVAANEYTQQFSKLSRPLFSGMAVLKPGGLGELSQTNIVWQQTRSMPRTPGALVHKGILFVVTEEGVLQSIDADTGKMLKKDRIDVEGQIYSSPALGDGKIYIGTRAGQVAVVSAQADWKVLSTAVLNGDIQASVAIADGRVFIRSSTHLYCFGDRKK